jgi:hypothetical protein
MNIPSLKLVVIEAILKIELLGLVSSGAVGVVNAHCPAEGPHEVESPRGGYSASDVLHDDTATAPSNTVHFCIVGG